MGNKIVVTNKNFDIVPTDKPISGYTGVECFKGTDYKNIVYKIFLAKVEVPIGATVVKPKKPMVRVNEHRTNQYIITDIINHNSVYENCRTRNYVDFGYKKGETHNESMLCKSPDEVNDEGLIFLLEKDRKDAEDYVYWYQHGC